MLASHPFLKIPVYSVLGICYVQLICSYSLLVNAQESDSQKNKKKKNRKTEAPIVYIYVLSFITLSVPFD